MDFRPSAIVGVDLEIGNQHWRSGQMFDVPLEFRPLYSSLKSEWFGDSDIALDRQLTDGHSGAYVFLIDVRPRSNSEEGELGNGQYILKLDHRNWPGTATEDERIAAARKWCPRFYSKHIAELYRSKVLDDRVAMVYARPVTDAQTLLAEEPRLTNGLRPFLKCLSADLLKDMNSHPEFPDRDPVSSSEMLHRWLGYRLNPIEGRSLQSFAESITRGAPTWTVGGTALVDALWFCKSDLAKRDQTHRPIKGLIHGDLHLGNILRNPSKRNQYWLIDFALSSDADLGYDHAYLEFSVILRHLSSPDPGSLVRILSAVVGEESRSDMEPLEEACVECIRAIRSGIKNWRQGPERNRQSAVDQQMRLARVAAGLNWANKTKLSDDQRILALTYASWSANVYLRDYLNEEYKELTRVASRDRPFANVAERSGASKNISAEASNATPATFGVSDEDFFSWVDRQFSNVSYLRLRRPVDPASIQTQIRVKRNPADSTLKGGNGPCEDMSEILLAPPDRVQLHQIITDLSLGQAQCEDVLTRNGLWDPRADKLPDTAPDRLDIFRALQSKEVLANSRRKTIEDLLRTNLISPRSGNAFYFNGQPLAVPALYLTRQLGRHGAVTINLSLQPTDYYTYRTIARCSSEILTGSGLGSRLALGPNLERYLPQFQEFVHLSASALVVVHSTQDNKLIVRRRSYQAADFDDGGKLFVSACEGLYRNDLQMKDGLWVVNFEQVIRNALRKELFGEPPKGSPEKDLINEIQECSLLGVCVYTPNLSIALCFLASVNCTSAEALSSARFAEHGGLEFYEDPDEEQIGFPEFTFSGVERFVRETIITGKANDTWCEGCLVALILALSARR